MVFALPDRSLILSFRCKKKQVGIRPSTPTKGEGLADTNFAVLRHRVGRAEQFEAPRRDPQIENFLYRSLHVPPNSWDRSTDTWWHKSYRWDGVQHVLPAPGLAVGILRVLCNGMCTAQRFTNGRWRTKVKSWMPWWAGFSLTFQRMPSSSQCRHRCLEECCSPPSKRPSVSRPHHSDLF